MASGKTYKNVYTILEKVKKGEIDTYYKGGDSLFSRINYYKKPDLIKPHMHYIDENKLDTMVETYINDAKVISKEYTKFTKSTTFHRDIPDGQKPDAKSYAEKLKENYEKIPKHLQRDIYKMYYHKMSQLEFEDRTDKNATKFKMLERANNPVGKIMSETSSLKSAIYTRNMMMYYAMRMTAMEYVDPNANDQFGNGMDGEGDPDQMEQMMKDMFDSAEGKKDLDDAMNDAQQTCKGIDDIMDQDLQEKMFDQANQHGGNDAGSISPEYIRQIAANLQRVRMSLGSMKEKIKRLMDKSTSYFSAKKETIYEDMFNSDNLAGLDDFFLLHPKLRKFSLEDVVIKDTRSIGRIDVYIDISGSMSDSCGTQNDQGQSISKLDFAKAFTVKLKEMGMLNDVYVFNNRVTKYKNDAISLAMLDTEGGTTINAAVSRIEKEQNNALVITDAEDSCSLYSEKAFFIGVKGARFSHFNSDTIEKYSEKAQVVVFDGTRISAVDKHGREMK